jgi:hypothetical protein
MTSLYNKNNDQVKKGLIGEEIKKYFLCEINKELFINFNHDDKYDIKTNNGSYEIKTDSNYKKYDFNSLFCEFQSGSKDSGIKTTESDFYIFVGPKDNFYKINDIYLFETKTLKDITNNELKYKLVKRNAYCKDYNNNDYTINTGYILHKDILNNYAT